MKLVYKIYKVLRSAEARSRSVISAYLISPRTVIRMLGYRHKLDVRIAHVKHIRNKLVRYFAIIKIMLSVRVRFAVARSPRTQVHFINVHRCRVKMLAFKRFSPARKPPRIAPFCLHGVNYRRCICQRFRIKRIRIGFHCRSGF